MCSRKINECFPSWTNKVNENWKPPNVFCVAYPGYHQRLEEYVLLLGETEEAPTPRPDVAVERSASFAHLVKRVSGGLEQSSGPGAWQVPAPSTCPAPFPAGPACPQGPVVLQKVMVLHTFAHELMLTDTHCPAPFPHANCQFIHCTPITADCHSSFLALLPHFNSQTFMCLWYSWTRPTPHLPPKQSTENILKARSCLIYH